MQSRFSQLPRRVRWPLLSVLVALLGLGTLYSGYCYGVWGRNNLLLQYLFQCNCPAASEQVRYHEFTVLVPACRWPVVKAMSADGRYLIVTETASPRTTYRLDLTTGERSGMQMTNTPFDGFRFLTNDLVLASERASRYALIDGQRGMQVPVRWQYIDQLDPATITALQHAAQLISMNENWVALAPDPLRHPDQNVVLAKGSWSVDLVQERLAVVGVTLPLTRPGVPYITHAFPSERHARHDELWADTDGIHAAGSNMLLQPTLFTANPQYGFFAYVPVGWTTDDAAVVYASRTRYVIEHWTSIYAPEDHLPVPQPVLLLDAPPVPPSGG